MDWAHMVEGLAPEEYLGDSEMKPHSTQAGLTLGNVLLNMLHQYMTERAAAGR